MLLIEIQSCRPACSGARQSFPDLAISVIGAVKSFEYLIMRTMMWPKSSVHNCVSWAVERGGGGGGDYAMIVQ